MSPLPGYSAIIVVDDVNLVSRPMARMLAEAGYRVYEAGSGEEALEVLRTIRRPIDLVITDVRMPEMSGVELMRRITAEWPATKLLFMSAYPAEVLVQEGLAHLAMHFLAKPFTRAELLQKVQEAISLQRRARERASGAAPQSDAGPESGAGPESEGNPPSER